MSILNGIQALFGGASTIPASNQPPVQQPNNPMQTGNPGQPLPGTIANPTTAANGLIPDPKAGQQPAPGQDPQTPQSPLDAIGDIWNTKQTPGTEQKPIFAGFDPAKVMESARKVDFSKAITPTQLEAIGKGGAEAVKAFAEALNSVSQTVYAQNAMATTQIVERALTEQDARYQANLPSMVRKFSANENVRTENPLLSHPAVQPLVPALTEMFTRKNPNASSTEIAEQVGDYFNRLGTVFAPVAPKSRDQLASEASQTDWDKFLIG